MNNSRNDRDCIVGKELSFTSYFEEIFSVGSSVTSTLDDAMGDA
jgi:hypothetical protein